MDIVSPKEYFEKSEIIETSIPMGKKKILKISSKFEED